MIKQLNINTSRKEEFINITRKIQDVVEESGISDGVVTVFIPHTTAAVTINENADPDVVTDMLYALKRAVPDEGFRHYEGNSTAHVKSSMMGFSETIIVSSGKLVLGTWQGIYFCEFDGARNRKAYINIAKN